MIPIVHGAEWGYDRAMNVTMPTVVLGVGGLLAVFLGGCDRAGPYVQPINDYTIRVRDAEPAKLTEEQRRQVRVCYNSNSAAPEEIRRLAAEECVKRGLVLGRYRGNDTLGCSLAQPARAYFHCADAPPAPPVAPKPGVPLEGKPMADPDPPPELPPHLRPGGR